MVAAHGPRTSQIENGSETSEAVAVHGSPALAEIFSGLAADRDRRILDLGPATRRNVEHYATVADRMRFVHLLGGDPAHDLRQLDPTALVRRLEKLVPFGTESYDLILTWSSFDYVEGAHVSAVASRLATVAAPGARLHAMIATTNMMPAAPLRYEIVGPGRIAYLATTEQLIPAPNPPPAKVERWLEPFRVDRCVVLRHGIRELIAVAG